jgi:methionine synthase I (cobalamin-dependent)
MKYIGMGTLEDMKYIGKNPVEDMKVFAKMIGSAFSNNDPFNPAVIPNMTPALAGAGATINQTNTFNIHSTAPAEDVGRAVVREQDHATGAAANHIARRSDTK